MTHESSAAEMVARTADESLLDQDLAGLPDVAGRPQGLPPSSTRKRLVGIGATLTAVTLLVGIALLIFGVVEAVAASLVPGIAALAVGAALVGTHWGWVHVAEATADSIEERRGRDVLARRREWLQTIKPYTRYQVTTAVQDDGSIKIIRIRHRPVPTPTGTFTFVREILGEEVHSAEESSAAVTERAELLRRQAATDTQSERERLEAAADALQTALLASDDERQRLAAQRAASEALSERINSNLRDPPLVE